MGFHRDDDDDNTTAAAAKARGYAYAKIEYVSVRTVHIFQKIEYAYDTFRIAYAKIAFTHTYVRLPVYSNAGLSQ